MDDTLGKNESVDMLEKLKEEQKTFKKNKGLELLLKDKPGIRTSKEERLKTFLESHQKEADKYFGNKKFFISLVVNLFMVTASCFALNLFAPTTAPIVINPAIVAGI